MKPLAIALLLGSGLVFAQTPPKDCVGICANADGSWVVTRVNDITVAALTETSTAYMAAHPAPQTVYKICPTETTPTGTKVAGTPCSRNVPLDDVAVSTWRAAGFSVVKEP